MYMGACWCSLMGHPRWSPVLIGSRPNRQWWRGMTFRAETIIFIQFRSWSCWTEEILAYVFTCFCPSSLSQLVQKDLSNHGNSAAWLLLTRNVWLWFQMTSGALDFSTCNFGSIFDQWEDGATCRPSLYLSVVTTSSPKHSVFSSTWKTLDFLLVAP